MPIVPTTADLNRGGHETLVCSLLLGGACPSAKDKKGDTPLHLAAWRGRAGIASALLLKGAQMNALDSQGRVRGVKAGVHQKETALLWLRLNYFSIPPTRVRVSRYHKHREAKTTPNEPSPPPGARVPSLVDSHNSKTPLIVAAEHGARGSTEALLMANADTDVRYGENELSSLDSAASHGHIGVLKTLVQHGVDVNAVDSTGYTALHMVRTSFYHGCRVVTSQYGMKKGPIDVKFQALCLSSSSSCFAK